MREVEFSRCDCFLNPEFVANFPPEKLTWESLFWVYIVQKQTLFVCNNNNKNMCSVNGCQLPSGEVFKAHCHFHICSILISDAYKLSASLPSPRDDRFYVAEDSYPR